jgi:hypothetical protein
MRQAILTRLNTFIDSILVPVTQMVPVPVSGRRKGKTKKLQPLPNLSRASKCVWQMDREA